MNSPSPVRKVWSLLTPRERRTAPVLLFLMFVGMTLEALGVGLVIPAVSLMTQPDLAASYPALGPWLARLGHPTQAQLVAGGMLALVGLYSVKTLFLAFLAWKQSEFVYDVKAGLSQRLFTGYLRQPWAFHLQRNSAQLIRNVITETNQFIGAALRPGMLLMTECLVILGIGTLLIAIEPLGALAVGFMLWVTMWGFQRLAKGRAQRWGEARQYHEGLLIQHLQQGLGGAKDVKLLGREAEFIAQFGTHNLGRSRVEHYQDALVQLPRLWLELLAVTGIAALVLMFLGQSKPLSALLPTVGLFAVAAFRLLPSVNRAVGALQQLRYGLPAINVLHQEVQLLDGSAPPPRGDLLPFTQAITLRDLSYRYSNADAPALIGVNMTIPRGAAVGLIGGSGAGKTTLVDVILGLLPPASGRVSVDGTDIQANLRGWQDQIGYVPQDIFLTDDTVRRNVAFGLREEQIDDVAVRRALRAAQLEDFVDGLPEGLNTMVGERGVRLSGGQRQRIGIARGVYHDPPVLVLDEATSALDIDTEQGVLSAVNALLGVKTLLIVTHRMTTVAYCSQLYRIEQGQIVEDRKVA